MLFNSFNFLYFLIVIFSLYWVTKNLLIRNVIILFASYFFYGLWDYRFLSLIAFSTLVDYFCAIAITKHEAYKKWFLYLSLTVNLGLLFIFKYFNFFSQSWYELWSGFGYELSPFTLHVVLPVGISFYTFQTLSYTIDVYRGKLPSTRNILRFASYVSFFPQLVAGPIERAKNLLPQFSIVHRFNFRYATNGIQQILWGLFKKVVIADNCGAIVGHIFENYESMNGISLAVALVLFSFQIYGDFSGYSDIAIGTAKLFGFKLMTNFKYPYFSRDIAEFWRRWHISLSTWFRDYIYIPLGGSKRGMFFSYINIFIVFLISGFWHGANWTFIVWGALNALYYLPLYVFGLNRSNLSIVAQHSWFPNLKEVFLICFNFLLVSLTWLFFRADNMGQAINYLSGMFSFEGENIFRLFSYQITIILISLFTMITLEWFFRKSTFPFFKREYASGKNSLLYCGIIILIILFGYQSDDMSFIYFQF